jgi:hypothetical protein
MIVAWVNFCPVPPERPPPIVAEGTWNCDDACKVSAEHNSIAEEKSFAWQYMTRITSSAECSFGTPVKCANLGVVARREIACCGEPES